MVFNWLNNLFHGGSAGQLVYEGYFCCTTITLPRRIRTPGGSNVTVLNVWVDIFYRVQNDNIIVHRARLSHGGGGITGSSRALNVASERTGEAWYTSRICSEADLRRVVEAELAVEGSALRRLLKGKWYGQFSDKPQRSASKTRTRRILDQHLAISDRIKANYKKRDTDPDALNRSIAACREQIAMAPKACLAFQEDWGYLPAPRGFKQLAIILAKQGKDQEAIELCQEASAQGWPGDWDKRIERLRRKKEKRRGGR